ncbi:hypothetical protein HF086_007315 [Spodoptera exigua]|uniref:PiggyBac transposable element-derived protein domain-containing protein n=1 Tax=Spodoptera exigua TaxID=7107 RepID=A0A922SKP1_SPOEX|nr:hypothetical protein HF086_007315 [Spodoptera exigua]
MKPEDIETILRQLENGEISEDESSDNEDEIDYYSSQRDLQMEVEDEDHEGISFADPELEANSRLDNEASEIHNLGITEQSPTPSVNNYTCNPRNLVWRVKNMDTIQNAFEFKGNTACSPEILSLETPFQFFSYFFDEELLKFLMDESNKYAFPKKSQLYRTCYCF